MTLPTDVKLYLETLGPYDTVEYKIDVSPILESGEGVATYSLVLPTESTLLGLQLNTTGGYSTTLVNNIITYWLSISSGHQADSIFMGAGVTMPIEVTVTTNSIPPRIKKRTVAVTVATR